MVGVSSWKKGHYASNVPLPRSRTHMDKGQKQSDLLIIFFIRKRACHICTPLCPLFRKSRYSAYHGCSKNYFVSFLLYIDLVFCFFAPEKTIFWNSITFSDPGVLLQYLSKKSKHCCVILLKSICILCLI